LATPRTDEDLLTSADPRDFGAFYARHLPGVERYFACSVGRDVAADLAAETFASALVTRRRFSHTATPAAGWLYTIAARRLVDFHRRRAAEQRALDALAAADCTREPLETTVSADLAQGLLRHLPAEQRDAILAHVIKDRAYPQVAADSGTSEASVRQRVSRGLGALRAPLRVYRIAQELARQDRMYRYGGGHRRSLTAIGPRDALDCSAATSLILKRAQLFEADVAWTSGRIAGEWGSPGEGRYVTVWANGEHVWLEFKLDADRGERFDPTPSRLAPNSGWIVRNPGPKSNFTPRHRPGL
jgi:RNA polymerase sigma factor (sigma-70 family)